MPLKKLVTSALGNTERICCPAFSLLLKPALVEAGSSPVNQIK
jgi:hypothetical protein